MIYWKDALTTKEDERELFAHTVAEKIIVVEKNWLEQIRKTKLYVYTLPADTFTLFEDAKNAGYYISEKEVLPVKVEALGDLLEKIINENVELRMTPNLTPIRNRLIASSVHFSIIRFRNANNRV